MYPSEAYDKEASNLMTRPGVYKQGQKQGSSSMCHATTACVHRILSLTLYLHVTMTVIVLYYSIYRSISMCYNKSSTNTLSSANHYYFLKLMPISSIHCSTPRLYLIFSAFFLFSHFSPTCFQISLILSWAKPSSSNFSPSNCEHVLFISLSFICLWILFT